MKIKTVFKPTHLKKEQLPKVATKQAAGLDLSADIEQSITIQPGCSQVIGTGVYTAIPEGFVGLVFIRSGVGFKYDCTLANSVGVIDADYRGEIKVKVVNHGKQGFSVASGDRIAQLVVVPYTANYQFVDQLDETERGTGGFGSTGKQ